MQHGGYRPKGKGGKFLADEMAIERSFPRSRAVLIDASGCELAEMGSGVDFVLHRRAPGTPPHCAELITCKDTVLIGLSFHGKELIDFDGVFFLPRELGEILKELGYNVPVECFA